MVTYFIIANFFYRTYKITNPHQVYMFACSINISLFSLSVVGISKGRKAVGLCSLYHLSW